jgi:hypothetical protein
MEGSHNDAVLFLTESLARIYLMSIL